MSRLIKTNVILLLSMLVFCSFARGSDRITLSDVPSDNYEIKEYNAGELSQISNLEKEVQELTGRVEMLEHTVRELRASTLEAKSAAIAPGLDNSASTEQAVSNGKVDKKTEQREYDHALSTLKDEKYEEAEKMFDNFIEKYPRSGLLSNAYFWHSETFYRRNDLDKAAIHYLKHYQKFPGSAKAPDSLLKLALSLGELKKKKEACVILKKLDDEFKKRSSSSKKRSYDAKIKFGCK